jgi:hypothetical protein
MDVSTGVFLSAQGFRENRKVFEMIVNSISTPPGIPDSIFSLDPKDLAAA